MSKASYKKITNNTMISWSVMLGVNPGYDNTTRLTPECALQKAMPFIRYHLMKPGYTKLRVVEPAIAVYNRAWGCPDGGESGVVIKGDIYPYLQKQTESRISNLMADLGQSTININWLRTHTPYTEDNKETRVDSVEFEVKHNGIKKLECNIDYDTEYIMCFVHFNHNTKEREGIYFSVWDFGGREDSPIMVDLNETETEMLYNYALKKSK